MSGNDCGRRFSIEYVTPIPGCSLGFALVLGRECGKSVAAFIDDPDSVPVPVPPEIKAPAQAGPGAPGGPGEGGPEGEGAPAEGGDKPADDKAPADDKPADDKPAAEAAPAEEKETVDCSPCHGDAHKPGDENPHGY